MVQISTDFQREMDELVTKLSLSKRIGFFFGAGTSMSFGLPGIDALTEAVIGQCTNEEKEVLKVISKDLEGHGVKPNIEEVLNCLRLIRQITRNGKEKNYCGISGEQAKKIDRKICINIYKIISEKEDQVKEEDKTIVRSFFAWLNLQSRDYVKEIFTPNYDLIFEKSLESLQIPYFDGFVGSCEPFFVPESVENKYKQENLPNSWVRLWKLHGSLGWLWVKNQKNNTDKVIRAGKEFVNACINKSDGEEEIVIYPSREKYELSRKQPFITYLDRFRDYLAEGEGILFINGYSYSDEHINEVIFSGLRNNNRLHIISFQYSDEDLKKLAKHAEANLNLSIFSPTQAFISGKIIKWTSPVKTFDFWDSSNQQNKLGDFKNFVQFLVQSSGKSNEIKKIEELK